jgi:hypothetical protein
LPHKCLPIVYSAKAQLTPDADTSELLDEHHKLCIQEIVRMLFYYTWVVNNKLLVALSTIAAQQSCATIATKQAVHLLLDCVATYPSDGIIYQASDMILCAHLDARFVNETNPAVTLVHTSSSQRTGRFHSSMVLFSQLPKSSSLLWHRPMNLNLQPFL